MQIHNLNNLGSYSTSINTKPARTVPTATSKAYYFYAAYDGSNLYFTDKEFTPVFNVKQMGTLGTLLIDSKNKIEKLVLTGEANATDFATMRDMENLTYLDLSQVTCEDNKIPNNAFGDFTFPSVNKKIKTVVLPESITSIGDGAFSYCTALSGSLTIPNGVTTIGNKAFYECGNLNGSLILSDELVAIGESAFDNCRGFKGSLTIPNKVTTIGSRAFAFCQYLSGLVFQEGSKLTTIGKQTFYECERIAGTLTIPVGVTSIGSEAFNKCLEVSAFRFSNPIPVVYTSNMLDVNGRIEVHAEVVDTYKAQTGWNELTDRIVAIAVE